MKLKAGEAVFQSGEARINKFTIKGKNSEELLEGLDGTLYLTNYRLVMEKELSPGELRVIFEFSLEALWDIETKGVFGRVLNLEADLSRMRTGSKEKRPELKETFGSFSIKIHDLTTWASQLTKAIQGRKKEM